MAVSGIVGISVETWRESTPRLRETLLLHEFAHLVGLDHVDDPNQNMYPYLPEEGIVLGPGDLAGLAALRESPCSSTV
jgi:Matrixin.